MVEVGVGILRGGWWFSTWWVGIGIEVKDISREMTGLVGLSQKEEDREVLGRES